MRATIFYSGVYEEAVSLIANIKIFCLAGAIFLHRIKIREAAILPSLKRLCL